MDNSFFSFNNLLLLPVLVGLEAVLSADNAVALATIAIGLKDRKQQRFALNIGLSFACLLRIIMLLLGTWVVQFKAFQLLGAGYLLWLVYGYFSLSANDEDSQKRSFDSSSIWQVIPMIAITDLAFSIDSITTAIAVSDRVWLIVVGVIIGIVILRLLSGLFISWLKEYTYLEPAGFIAVGLVGLRLLLKVIIPAYTVPEWLIICSIFAIFIWGFSKRNQPEEFVTLK